MKTLAALAVALIVAAVLIYEASLGWYGENEVAGTPTARAAAIRELVAAAQRTTRAALGADASKQIPFGDFHVHTTFSFDAFMMNMPMAGGQGSHPPTDACDFARHCSNLDFWSINDHAENLTPRLWSETVEAVRQCNEIAGDPANPDLVTYLGWEWSHIGTTPDNHYGHKNVVLLETEEDQVPTRPIGARSPATEQVQPPWNRLGHVHPRRLGLAQAAPRARSEAAIAGRDRLRDPGPATRSSRGAR